MAGPRRRHLAGRPDRHRADFVAAAGPDLPPRARHRLWHARRARRAHRHHPHVPVPLQLRRRGPALHAGRRLHPRLRAAHPRRRELRADEFAEAPRRAAGARRQAVQRDRASRRKRDAVHRHGERFTCARVLRADDPCRRPRRRAADHGRPWQRAGGGRRSAAADRAALRGGGRSAGGTASHADARCAAGRGGRRLHLAALRPRRVPDRGRAHGRLVPAAA